MEKVFTKKWCAVVVDSVVSVLNISLDHSANRTFEMLLEALFALAGQALQLTIAAIFVCQTAANWTRATISQHDLIFQDCTLPAELPSVLLFCVDALEQVMTQICRMALIPFICIEPCGSNPGQLKLPVKDLFSFEEGCLFGEALENLIKDLTGEKILLSQRNVLTSLSF